MLYLFLIIPLHTTIYPAVVFCTIRRFVAKYFSNLRNIPNYNLSLRHHDPIVFLQFL